MSCYTKNCTNEAIVEFYGKLYCDDCHTERLGPEYARIENALFSGVWEHVGADHEKRSPRQPQYNSIEEYTEKTGKRFRMTKCQKQRGLTRDQAFKETYG